MPPGFAAFRKLNFFSFLASEASPSEESLCNYIAPPWAFLLYSVARENPLLNSEHSGFEVIKFTKIPSQARRYIQLAELQWVGT